MHMMKLYKRPFRKLYQPGLHDRCMPVVLRGDPAGIPAGSIVSVIGRFGPFRCIEKDGTKQNVWARALLPIPRVSHARDAYIWRGILGIPQPPTR